MIAAITARYGWKSQAGSVPVSSEPTANGMNAPTG